MSPANSVRQTLSAYRAALTAGDRDQCIALTDPSGAERAAMTGTSLGTHPLLLRAGDSGLTAAFQDTAGRAWCRLAADWWSGARSVVQTVRTVSPDLVEAYELVEHPIEGRQELATVLVLRGAAWLVVRTTEAVPDVATLDLLLPEPAEQVAFSVERYRSDHAQIFDTGSTAVVGSDGTIRFATRLGEVLGRILPSVCVTRHVFTISDRDDEPYMSDAIRTARSVLRLATVLPDDYWERIDRLTALANTTEVVGTQFDPLAVVGAGSRQYFWHDFCQRSAETGEAVGAGDNKAFAALGGFWVGFRTDQGYLRSDGLRYFRLPEFEVPIGPHAAQVLEQGTLRQLSQGPDQPIHAGTPIGRVYQVLPGRLGPGEDDTYGRWGSLCFAPTSA